MPSVKVKKSCCGGAGASNQQRSLADIFPPPIRLSSGTPEPPEPTVVRVENDAVQELSDMPGGVSGLRPINRPRSSSRVSEHCMNRSSRMFRPRSHHDSLHATQTVHSQHSTTRNEIPAGERPISEAPARSRDTIHSTGRVWSINSGNDVDEDHHRDDIVEHLDVIDPQVATVSNLTNAANSILIPPLSFYSRKPILVLPDLEYQTDAERREPFEDSLDRHVADVLERPSKFRRTMRGVWSFLKTPLGAFVFVYGFLVVFWGAAIVLFLAKIINLHNPNTQGFWVEVSSQIENGLFTLTGLGLLPSRILDTYRIYKIWHYKRRVAKLRAKAGLPQLYDVDDLPDPAYDPNYVHVLTDKEQRDLHKQQEKLRHNQTWYRPHGTETHRAFPINTALLICCLNDGNSFFQILLCGTMWGLNRFQRPAWSTATLIPASFLCGISAAVFIWRGGQKTKRTKEIQERLRQVLELHEKNGDNKTAAVIDVGVINVSPPTNEGSTEAGNSPDLETGEHIMTIPLIISNKEKPT